MPYTYQYPRPALTVDCVVFGIDGKTLKILLIQRDFEPYQGKWALPGGFVNMDETLAEAARRELAEETDIRNVALEQLSTFDKPDRDPRERVISVAYYALVNLPDHQVRAATDARDAAWFSIAEVPGLAFDHDHILEVALQKLKETGRFVMETT